MDGIVYDFEYRFVNEGGSAVMLTQHELKAEQIDQLQVEMLRACDVRGLLPIQVEEMNLQIRFKYGLYSKRLLSHALIAEAVHFGQRIELLFQLIDTLQKCKDYMLTETNFVLDPKLLFTNENLTLIEMVYIPVLKSPEKPTVAEELRNIVMLLFPEQSKHNLLFNPFEQTDFSLDNLKQTLLQHMQPMKQAARTVFEEELETYVKDEYVAETTSGDETYYENVSNIEKGREKKLKRLSTVLNHVEKYKFRYMCAAFPIITIWFWAIHQGSDGAFLMATGMTGLIASLLTGLNAGLQPHHKQQSAADLLQSKIDALELPIAQAKEEKDMDSSLQTISDLDQYVEQLPGHTTLLQSAHITLPLIDQEKPKTGKRAALFIVCGNQRKQVEIEGDQFIIGRGPHGVDYIDSTIGLSRVHLEIIKTGSTYEARDLGSTNGTYMNDEKMIPFKKYELVEGDQLRFIKNIATFKMIEGNV